MVLLPTRTQLLLVLGVVVSAHVALYWHWVSLGPDVEEVIPFSGQRYRPLFLSVLEQGRVMEGEDANAKQHTIAQDDLPLSVERRKALTVHEKRVATTDRSASVGGAEQQGVSAAPLEDAQGVSRPDLMADGAYLIVPSSSKLSYQITGMYRGVPWGSGVGVLDWHHQGDAYSLEFTFPHRSGRLKTQTSRGQLSLEDGLLPVRFGDRLQGERAVHFQRVEGAEQIRFSANKPSVELQSHAQDQLSVLIQLAAIVSGQRASKNASNTQVSFQVATAYDASIWVFNIKSLVDNPKLVYVDKMPIHPYDGRWELWLSVDLGYLPVKWRVSFPNGDFYECLQTAGSQSLVVP